MCNFSDFIEQRGIEKGLEQGLEKGLRKGLLQGKAEGKKEGKAEAVLELLEELGELSADLRERIISEEDLMLLKQWHKEAAKAESIQMFLARTRLI